MSLNYNPEALFTKGEAFRINIDGLDFAFEKKLFAKLITMCKRITKPHPMLDACLTNSGYEGDGKTNTSLVEAIIAQQLIGTSIHLFFKTSSCIKFAQNNSKKIIILDEPSFESLSTDSSSNLNKDFLRLTSTMRKKRHFFIINFAKFWKFPEFLVVDRSLGMVHMDSKNGKTPGRFIYIKKDKLEDLWKAKKKSNKSLFTKLMTFGGQMPYLMEEIFDKFEIQVEEKMNATIDDYDYEKDYAIKSIGTKKEVNKKEEIYRQKLLELRKKVSGIWRLKNITQLELAKYLGINSQRLREWKYIE